MMHTKKTIVSLFLLYSQTIAFTPANNKNAFHSPTTLNFVDPADPANIEHAGSPTTKSYKLNSNRISELTHTSTAEDVIAAIKRAQNLKDAGDIRVIGDFLLKEVDDSFAYGYKGAILSRYAVAALRVEEFESAKRAIDMRKERFSPSMMPFESAAILRGLLRLGMVSEAFEVLEDELYIEEDNEDRLKHRSLALASIASRHFFANEPKVAVKACKMLSEMGPAVRATALTAEDLDMPWYRILAGADQCKIANYGTSYDSAVLGAVLEFPLDPNFQKVLNRAAHEK